MGLLSSPMGGLSFAAANGLIYTQGALPVSTMVVDRCNGTTETVTVNKTFDPVRNDNITLPLGNICSVTLNLSNRVLVGGAGTAGGMFGLSLDVGSVTIPFDQPITVVASSTVVRNLQLADTNWVTATLLDLTAQKIVIVGANHALHNQLRDDIKYDSAGW
jgi:hypothetical protein